jgi:hypothetical protein
VIDEQPTTAVDRLRLLREERIASIIQWAAGDQLYKADHAKITVSLEDDCADVTIEKMYDGVDFGIDEVAAIAKLLGTDRINFGHRSYERGCSSCDFGSKSTVKLRILGIRFPVTSDPGECRWCCVKLTMAEVISGANEHDCTNWNGCTWDAGDYLSEDE